MNKVRVFLGMPLYDGTLNFRAAASFLVYPSRRENVEIMHATFGCSLLGRTFSVLWAQALNNVEQGLTTHFGMLHSDVAASQYWVDTMLDELQEHNADICSAVIPIKDMKGITSTAIANPTNPWQPARRLTMAEILRLPETFDAEDCHKAGFNPEHAALLVNTGCWLCSLERPWWYGNPANQTALAFRINDKLRRNVQGKLEVATEPEDWCFSREAAQYGAKIIATRKVQVEHHGSISWSNTDVWGQWTHDEETLGPVPPEKANLVTPDDGGDGQPQTEPLVEGVTR